MMNTREQQEVGWLPPSSGGYEDPTKLGLGMLGSWEKKFLVLVGEPGKEPEMID